MIDITGKNSEPLKKKRLYLLDMDGTIYNENQIFDGTLEFLEEIKRRGGEYIFITNNSSKSVEDYVKKVRDMGIRQWSRISIPPARLRPCISRKTIRDRWFIVWNPPLW